MEIYIRLTPIGYIFPFYVIHSMWRELVQCAIQRKSLQSSQSSNVFSPFLWMKYKPYKINECNADTKIATPILIENVLLQRIKGREVGALLKLFSLVFILRILIKLSMRFRYCITFQFMTIEFAQKFLNKDFCIPTVCLVLP